VVRTPSVEAAFRRVDRRFFVPRNQVSLAHSDQPLREDHVHISAPHIYGTALEALELQPGSSQSFLNLGSGTGYLSCMAANILGPQAAHVAVEIDARTVQHAQESLEQWQQANPHIPLPPMEMIHGNALQIDTKQGEALTGFDRIYIGATLPRRKLERIAQLLKPGGILVGPVDDDLVKVLRVGDSIISSSDETTTPIPRSLRGQPPMLSTDFSVQILSGVRFASLLESPCMPTILPSRVWDPSTHKLYPETFRKACKEILLCARSDQIQLAPPVVPPQRINAASILPRALWMEILTYTTRDWFDKPRDTEDLLRRRLSQEQAALKEAQEARERAEARVQMMESERDLYKLLFLRCQTRLRAAVVGSGTTDNDEPLLNPNDDELPFLLSSVDRQGDFLRAMRILRRSVTSDDDDDEEEDNEDVDLEESEDDSEESSMAMEDTTVDTNDARPMEEDTLMVSAI